MSSDDEDDSDDELMREICSEDDEEDPLQEALDAIDEGEDDDALDFEGEEEDAMEGAESEAENVAMDEEDSVKKDDKAAQHDEKQASKVEAETQDDLAASIAAAAVDELMQQEDKKDADVNANAKDHAEREHAKENEDDDKEDDKDDEEEDKDDEEEDDDQDGAEEDEEEKPARKSRKKPKDPNAPKKPLNPYSQFAQSKRPELLEQGIRDLSALGKATAALWAEVPDAEKEKQQAAYNEVKQKWDAEMDEYKKTKGYRKFQEKLRDWLDERELRKLDKREKARDGGCPKRPPSGFQMFATKVRPELLGQGLSMSDLGKGIAERWNALSSNEQASYNKLSKQAQAEHAGKLAAYKRSEGYHAYLDERAQIEVRQALKRLKADYEKHIPKRPPVAFTLWMKENKIQGSLSQVSKLYEATNDENKQKYTADAVRLRDKFNEDMAKFKASPEGKSFEREQVVAKRRALVRAARLKFLVDAPPRPPGAKVLFMAARRESTDLPTGLAGRSLSQHLEKSWEQASEAERRPFEEDAARKLEEFQKKLELFRQGPQYAKLKAIEEKAQGKKAKAKGKGKAKAKSKATSKAKSKAKSKGIGSAKSSVERPASMPAAPPSIMDLFKARQRTNGGKCGLKDFSALPAEEKASLKEEAEKQKAAHQEAMDKWEKTAEGKLYLKKVASAVKKVKNAEANARAKRKLDSAKAEFFSEVPKKPPSAMFLYASKADKGGGKIHERWQALSQEEKTKWEKEREQLIEEYNKKMEEFQKSACYKKAAGRPKAKAKGKASGQQPTNKPKKPSTAFLLFCSEKKLAVSVAGKAWAEAAPEDKKRFEEEAAKAKEEYSKALEAWKGSAEGKKIERGKDAEAMKKKEKQAREKYLKDEPEPPPPAFRLYVEERKTKSSDDASKAPSAAQARQIAEDWKNLDEAGKKVYTERHEALRKEYEAKLKVYKESTAYKQYLRASGKEKAAKAAKIAAREKEEHREAMAAIYGGGRSSGGRGRGRGRGGAAAAALSDSDSDLMGEDSDDSSLGLDDSD